MIEDEGTIKYYELLSKKFPEGPRSIHFILPRNSFTVDLAKEFLNNMDHTYYDSTGNLKSLTIRPYPYSEYFILKYYTDKMSPEEFLVERNTKACIRFPSYMWPFIYKIAMVSSSPYPN